MGPKRGVVLALAAVYVAGMSYADYRLNVAVEGPFTPAVRDLAGIFFVGAGLLAWWSRPSSRVGPLLFIAGLAWYVIDVNILGVNGEPMAVLYTVVTPLKFIFIVLVGHILLTFPGGRTESRVDRSIVAALYGLGATLQLAYMLTADTRRIDCPKCPANLLLTWPDAGLATAIGHAGEAATAVAALVVLGRVAVHWWQRSDAGRRVLAPVIWSAGPVAVTAVVLQWLSATTRGVHSAPVFALGPVVYATLPLALLAGLLRTRLDQARVGRLVVELSGVQRPSVNRQAMAAVLHDPTVQLVHWSAELDAYLDDDGVPVELPADESGRAVSLLEREGQPIGALVHDPALRDQPGLVRAVAAAAQMAVENENLAAELKVQLLEVEASRARIIAAADEERRRLEHDLHDGAQQRLLTLSFALKTAARRAQDYPDDELTGALTSAEEQLRLGLAELRELAHGIRPPALTQGGLGAALESLAERAPIPVTVASAPSSRYPQAVESTAYFVVSEALANAYKHAEAGQATVRAWEEDGELVVEVIDDGVGGADPGRGAGIRGLMDRVAALRGCLEVESATGRGTRLVARMPCA